VRTHAAEFIRHRRNPFLYYWLVTNSGGISNVPDLDINVPNVARVYDYMLGGRNNFAADRRLGDQFSGQFPISATIARQNRAFLGRAVRYCAGQGVRQFLDVGSGLPTMDNVHEVARRVIPRASVVYVDNDKVAHSHASALLATSDGVAAIPEDMREPARILAEVTARRLLDLTQPTVVVLAATLHLITDREDPAGIVAAFRDAIPSGSYLILSHATHDLMPEEAARARAMYRASSPLVTRSREEIAAFFAGFELLEPGLVLTTRWRPDEPSRLDEPLQVDERAHLYAGVGRKP
jgi:hypothetical protein